MVLLELTHREFELIIEAFELVKDEYNWDWHPEWEPEMQELYRKMTNPEGLMK